jgi:phosphoglycolate phosphatase-like HAD superfamily hydrolase
MVLDAMLLDIDGTLFDSNPLQVKAWQRAFEAHGYRVGRDRIEVEIGKGGNKLVASILGHTIDGCDGDSLRKSQAADSGTGRVQPPETLESQMPRIVGGVLAREARALFENFARTATDPLQRAFTQQLLALTR